MDVDIRNNDKGRGVYTTRAFRRGEVVVVGKPVERSPERTRLTLQLDVDHHARFDLPFELTNHSCDPNCGIKANDFGGYDLVAMRDIAEGEEVTWDYCMTEWVSIAVPVCRCNAAGCRGRITGGKDLTPALQEKYAGFLAPFYDKLMAQ